LRDTFTASLAGHAAAAADDDDDDCVVTAAVPRYVQCIAYIARVADCDT